MNNEVKKTSQKFWIETVCVFLQALILAFFIRTFFFQPFSIPSGSMRPTLLKGDYLFVSKWTYGYSRYSLPFSLDFFSGRIWAGEPKRGDIVVFRSPRDTSIDFIKRVIGLPGDKIQMRDGQIWLNGVIVPREKKGQIYDPDITEVNRPVDVYTETLPGGAQYDTLDIQPNSITDNTEEFHVPDGHYFMMGDNRDNSSDSRVGIGFVAAENLVGQAKIIFFSLSGDSSGIQVWRWFKEIRLSRLLKILE